jgi:hypothetical protein
VDEDFGQAAPLLPRRFVDDIMAGSFAIRQIKNDSSAILWSGPSASMRSSAALLEKRARA